MVSHCALVLIFCKILLKTCCFKCLIRHGTIRWWAELSDSSRFRSDLNTDPIVKHLTHYLGLYDLAENEINFAVLATCLKIHSTYSELIHDTSHLL